MAKLIGITGKAGAGKDTAFLNFDKARDYRVRQMAFGTGVKEAAAKVFNVQVKNFYTHKEDVCPEWGITYREMLQKLGTEFARDMIDKDFWVKWIETSWREACKQGYDYVFVTDVRFDNEAQWIAEKGGATICIERPGNELLVADAAAHASEAGVGGQWIFDHIQNDGTEKELGQKLDSLLRHAAIFDNPGI